MFCSAPIKKGPTVTIDLDSDSEPQRVAETGVSHASTGKGKNIVPTVEKGIQIMQAKEKRMNPIWMN
jgi:translation elongation factor P/translation initiation factor 5A